jgi:glucan phosphorylase
MANGAGQWFSRKHREHLSGPIAYFCAEYGIHESLGIYSGGLGVLAGDHMKSASDMALPFVGVGLLYRRGYFRQQIDADGHQEHNYADYDLNRLPLSRVQDRDGLPLTVSVELPGRELSVAVWLAQVGRVPVLLLDTDVAENADEYRPITHILYVRGELTESSERNHNYVRKVVNGRAPFRYFWADGSPDIMSISLLYFGDTAGNVWQMPYDMEQKRQPGIVRK